MQLNPSQSLQPWAWKCPCNVTLMSHPASKNPPHLNRLLTCPGVTNHTWTVSKKFYSNLQMQRFLSTLLFQNTGASLRKRLHFSLRGCLLYMHVFLKLLFQSLLQCLSPVTAYYFCLREIPLTQSMAVILLHFQCKRKKRHRANY